jgi:hypothetical protein
MRPRARMNPRPIPPAAGDAAAGAGLMRAVFAGHAMGWLPGVLHVRQGARRHIAATVDPAKR